MELAMIGLGKMGGNMSVRLLEGGHQVIGYNRSPEVTNKLAASTQLLPAFSLEEAVNHLNTPRIVWTMVPAGEPTEETILRLAELLSDNDIIIDGGNSNFNDTLRRSIFLRERHIHFVDVGTSGGIWGLAQGYSMMVGGDRDIVDQIRPLLETLAPAPDRGWGHVGPNGAGHFVKMIHNGIEYGMMEAYAEGFEILRARKDFDLDLYQVAEIWRYGSVIRSWLLDLTANALAEDSELTGIKGWVADSGEGRWTILEAINSDIPAPVITLSLFQRFASRQEESFAAKILAAMRNQFGGHEVKAK